MLSQVLLPPNLFILSIIGPIRDIIILLPGLIIVITVSF